MKGISKLRIYEVGTKIYVDVYYFDRTKEATQWNIKKERDRIMSGVDGYTIIEDTRVIK